MKRKPLLMIAATTLFCLAYCVARSNASGLPVVDVANLTQTTLTALQTLQSNINEAQQIANQIKSLENEFRNLESLEFSVIDKYRSHFQGLFDAVDRVNGLISDYAQLEDNFTEAYPDWNREAGLVPADVVSQKSREWLDKSRESMLGASLVGAKVLENLPQTQAELEDLVTNSQQSVGILQATQAGNQIVAQVAGNLTNLNTQLAKYSQAHMSYLMHVQQEEAANKNRLDHVLDSIYQGRRVAPPAPPRPL